MFKVSGKRYTDEFKIEAVTQVTDRGYRIGGVASPAGLGQAWQAAVDPSRYSAS